jgi:hypothetical protein
MRFFSLMVAGIVIPVLFTATASAAAPSESAAKATIASVWKLQKIEFHYFGRTSRYSCDGMSDKVRTLLMRMGARRDMKLSTNGCEIGRINLKGVNPGLSIEFWAPFPVTTADRPVTGAEPQAIDARYATFAFQQDVFRDLDVGDCELVEEFVRQILPHFATRSIAQNIACVPYQHLGGSYRVSGEVLTAVMTPADGTTRSRAAR